MSAAGDGEASAPVGPSEAEEAAFLAEQAASEASFQAARAAPVTAAEADAADGKPLPPLDDLVARIPAPTRALFDELFRAKFITVKRVPRAALKG